MNPRTALALAHDLLVVAIAWWLAFLLRFNFEFPPEWRLGMWRTGAVAWLLYAASFQGFRLYRGIWRFASLHDLRRILFAVAIAALCLPALILLAGKHAPVPRSVLVLHPILVVAMMGGSRFLYRALKDGVLLPNRRSGRPVLIVGAGDAAARLVAELGRSPAWRVVGLLDDNPRKLDRMVHGYRVLGPIETMEVCARKLGVAEVIISMPSVRPGVRRRAVELATAAGLKVLTVPAFSDLLSGRVSVSQIRPVELEDLLGREQVQLDTVGLSGLIAGRTVLVTGAGGSIGAELCRQIAVFSPVRLLLLERSEFALYTLEQEMVTRHPSLAFVPLAADVREPAVLDVVFRQYRPQLVFHAAAYKHVPLMERDNAWEAVRNNVGGTLAVAHAAQRWGVEEFVLVSTDKAVNPTNVMGATKRLAERICTAIQQSSGPRYVTVRFGNVLGSSGSVIPKFREQIARGGPVTVTHPEVTRYFMSIPEAAQLVLQAALMGRGGDIFVLDMGEPVKVAELARDMIRLSGFGDDDIRIEFTGLRPGEKLYEELLADSERTLATPHPKLRIARAAPPEPEGWLDAIRLWLGREAGQSEFEVKRQLGLFVPEYVPQLPQRDGSGAAGALPASAWVSTPNQAIGPGSK
ncbi:MAG: capsular polysaccharide biosynthesis protein [Betaproteobacteria bacterium]